MSPDNLPLESDIWDAGYKAGMQAAESAAEGLRDLFTKRNDWNRNLRDALVKIFTEAGWKDDCTLINYLTCMNFDAAENAPPVTREPDDDAKPLVVVEKPHPDSLRLDWLQANMPFGAAIGWDDADYYFACSPDGKVHCDDSLQLRSALDAAMSAPSAKGGES